MRKIGKPQDQGGAEIDLTPMLDVVFIMLIFFIVVASFIKEAGARSIPLTITSRIILRTQPVFWLRWLRITKFGWKIAVWTSAQSAPIFSVCWPKTLKHLSPSRWRKAQRPALWSMSRTPPVNPASPQ